MQFGVVGLGFFVVCIFVIEMFGLQVVYDDGDEQVQYCEIGQYDKYQEKELGLGVVFMYWVLDFGGLVFQCYNLEQGNCVFVQGFEQFWIVFCEQFGGYY